MLHRFARTRVTTVAVAATAVVAGVASYAAAVPTATATASSVASRPHVASGFSLHQFKHVWVIVLENEAESSTFGSPKTDPYLATTLRRKALFLKNYYAIGHNSLPNYVALASGQAPNTLTQEDCQTYQQFAGDSYATTPGEPNQQVGDGCVYPPEVDDIGNQLTVGNKSWAAYMEDMGNDPARDNPDHGTAACGHPSLNTRDQTQTAETGDGYAARHDPFVYFEKIIDDNAYCQAHVVAQGLTDGAMPKAAIPGEHGLAYSLSSASHTPAYSFITPNLCDDGHDYPCKTGQQTLASRGADTDRWLEQWVPKILNSAAYKKGGLLEITYDEAEGSNAGKACCNEQADPNGIANQAGANSGPGGGQVGALLLSPLLQGGKTSKLAYNHYSTLATDEDIFGLPRLGYAQGANTFLKAIKDDLKG